MGKRLPSFGLRIIFGCARSMNIINETYNWEMFCSLGWLSDERNDLEAFTAINILRNFFGEERPVLLLIDEISKAKFDSYSNYDDKVITDVGVILDSYGDIDVIVSSLSPNYIRALITQKSQRGIDYSILYPLIDFDYMKNESNSWIDHIIPNSKNIKNKFILNLIKATYLMVSGDPRSLEYLANEVFRLRHPNTSIFFHELEKKCCDNNNNNYCSILEYLSGQTALLLKEKNDLPESIEIDILDEFALNSVPFSDDSSEFRMKLETGIIFLQRVEPGKQFYSAIRAYHLIKAIFSVNTDLQWSNYNLSPRLQGFKTLFSNISNMDISDIWERSIDMTIFSRAYSGGKLNKVFGTMTMPSVDIMGPLIVRKASSNYSFNTIEEGTLFNPSAFYKGLDGFLLTNSLYIYTQ
jgi:hypothetical protein